jgi:hypothetical protein
MAEGTVFLTLTHKNQRNKKKKTNESQVFCFPEVFQLWTFSSRCKEEKAFNVFLNETIDTKQKKVSKQK